MCLPEGERDSQSSMALEAVVFPQDYPFGYGAAKDLYPLWPFHDDFNLHKQEDHHDGFLNLLDDQTENYGFGDWTNICSSELHLPNRASSDTSNNPTPSSEALQADSSNSRPKRRRARTRKNKEEIENQRMTHIAVERNRRKQMNEYLSVLRSLMPDSYVQRGDQASIIGGAINFVKELEQRLQFLGSQKSEKTPFSEFFTFPQYSTSPSGSGESPMMTGGAPSGTCIADIEVTMVESHANLKIRSRKRPKQLLRIVSALYSMRLTILHLNVTTTADIVLYCISVKLEEECKLGSVEEIAGAVYKTLEGMEQECGVQNQDPTGVGYT
ncbi:transcription factor bHLH96-like [Prosopis cineraria]|uniref:transcription factor bHLH96-like n=1 Tax=Prosopis cineraria TaxID=364024 RepID=UPI00240FCB41|nr:transcription factor bHLH96-like [Prosopis cineraria]